MATSLPLQHFAGKLTWFWLRCICCQEMKLRASFSSLWHWIFQEMEILLLNFFMFSRFILLIKHRNLIVRVIGFTNHVPWVIQFQSEPKGCLCIWSWFCSWCGITVGGTTLVHLLCFLRFFYFDKDDWILHPICAQMVCVSFCALASCNFPDLRLGAI